MSDARSAILERIRTALGDHAGSAPEPPRAYRRAADRDRDAVLEQFVDYVEEYRATVRRVAPDELLAAIEQLVGDDSCVVPADLERLLDAPLPAHWLRDEGAATVEQLAQTAAVVTLSAVGISSTGTIVLDGGAGQGRRIISLLPDHHVCVVRAEDVVQLVPEAVARLDAVQPQTWISGPSATSDIELDRVEGVHGPRRLSVLLVG